MKKSITAIALIVGVLSVRAQEVSVEKNMFGVQLGLLFASVQYEAKFDRKLAMHFETGILMNPYTIKSQTADQPDKSGYITAPFAVVEPRWYYGLDRRARLKRSTAHNSSNYFSLKNIYIANNLEIANTHENHKIVPAIGIIPSYGIRRSFAKNFNYEFAAGMGYQYNIFSESSGGCNCEHSVLALDLQAKIGYNF